MVCRFISEEKFFQQTDRGIKPYIWEIRCGHLENGHFNLSNKEGDSGKTVVVNAEGMNALKVIYTYN